MLNLIKNKVSLKYLGGIIKMKYLKFLVLMLMFCLVFSPVSTAYKWDSNMQIDDSTYSMLVTNIYNRLSSNIMKDTFNSYNEQKNSFGSNFFDIVSTNSGQYIGTSTTRKFHRATCRYVKRILSHHKVYYKTRQAAISAGYTPCKVCKP